MRSLTDLSATQVPPLLDGCNHRADSSIGQGQVQGLACAFHCQVGARLHPKCSLHPNQFAQISRASSLTIQHLRCLRTVLPCAEFIIAINMFNSQLLHLYSHKAVVSSKTALTRGLGLASILRMMSQGSMTGSHAATTWLKDQMLLRKPMYACMPQHNIKHAHSNALRHLMRATCPQTCTISCQHYSCQASLSLPSRAVQW